MNQGQRNALRVAQNFQRKAIVEGGEGIDIAMIAEILSGHIMTVDIDARAILNNVPQPTIRQTAELLLGADWSNNPPVVAVERLREHLSANFLVHQGLVSYNNTDIFTNDGFILLWLYNFNQYKIIHIDDRYLTNCNQ
jgi:hypothetical protein